MVQALVIMMRVALMRRMTMNACALLDTVVKTARMKTAGVFQILAMLMLNALTR